jgi:exonuclease SbcC
MLPQGRFQAFLRASSGERHAVLQRLFRTRRFEDVERWLVDRRIELRRRSQTMHDRCAGVVHRFQEAAGVGVPQEWEAPDLTAVAVDGSLTAWADEVCASSAVASAEARSRLDDVTGILDQRRTELDEATVAAEARARGERASRSLETLEATRDAEKALVRSLEGHGRAAPVLPLARQSDQAHLDLEAATREAAHHREAVATLLGTAAPVEADELGRAARGAAEACAVARSWLPREQELERERALVDHLTAEAATLAAVVEEGERVRVTTTADREALVAALGKARALAARRVDDSTALQATKLALAAAREVEELTRRLGDARSSVDAATQVAQDLREVHLDLRERRISGMAAELAGRLAVGGSCPVCGSVEHPSPAHDSGHVSRADEETARARHESADFERQARQELVTTLESQLVGVRSRSQDRDTAHWERVHEAAMRTLEQSTAAEAEVTLLEDQLDRLDAQTRTAAEEMATARVRLAEHAEQRVAAAHRSDQLDAERAVLLADHPGLSTVTQLVRRLTRSVSVLEAGHAATLTLMRSRDRAGASHAAAQGQALDAGFDSLQTALDAVLSDEELSARTAELAARRSARVAAEAVLADETVSLALSRPAPDLTGARAVVEEASLLRDAAHATHEQLDARRKRLATLVGELARSVAAWAPVRDEHAVVAALAALVEGKSADNQLRMRLSAYVLSERLRQVVATANERLGAMTDERYTLVQTDEKGAGEQRGGLSLRMRDEWTATERDPATLSGGETFLVSLALALGLADTVSNEAGGTQLDTLFIDEGFGTLDATTLDGVMDTLDSLRDGGRVVGLVSHVAELRNRVTAQLEVRKGRRGSTLCPVPADR